MRKYQQNQILELLETLGEAQSSRLYSDCQDCAIAIGEFIESIEGEGVQTVFLLEEYCELVFKTYNGELESEDLHTQLQKIIDCVKTELRPDKIEVVFLSYKADMSDSLETIYLAAKEDLGCDAYWIPIPYYDKNPDGTFSIMHYEGAEFYSDKFECTDWHEYDIELNRPDVVFTFNPYDGNNLVTSVHPDFYCARLREFTDCLVYVPYFVVEDDVNSHFVILPGVKNAHKVIVQSEKLRNTYVNEYSKVFGDVYGSPADKFVALGSPKIEKAANSKREDYTLPASWEAAIKGKQVILYNTSIASMLAGGEQYLQTVRQTIEYTIKSGKALWWRPHPLLANTYKSMRPELYKQYERIVADFEQSQMMIYDDCADLHRAIACSDMYYGDPSSVAALYKETGKPVIVCSNMITADKLIFVNIFDDGIFFYFTAIDVNALFKMHKETFEIELLGSFPDEKINGWNLYGLAAKCGEKLYFAPFWANAIGVYDISHRRLSKININEVKTKKQKQPNFLTAVTFAENVFMVSAAYPAIIKIDSLNDEVHYYDEWVAELESNRNSEDFYFSRGCVVEDKIFMPSCCANVVVEFDMTTCTSRTHIVGCNDYNYTSMCFDGDNFWIISRNCETVIKWNCDMGVCKEFCSFPPGFTPGERPFSNIHYFDGYVWLISYNSNISVKINVSSESTSIAEQFIDGCETGTYDNRAQGINYLSSLVCGDKIYSMSNKTKQIIEYDCKSRAKREKLLTFPKLEYLFDSISTFDRAANNPADSHSGCGKKIFEYIKTVAGTISFT